MPSRSLAALVLTLVSMLAAPAEGDEPKFEYKAPPEAVDGGPETVWKADVQAGFTWLTGNSESVGFSGSGRSSVRHHDDQLELFLQGAYARGGTSSTGPGGPIDGHVTSAQNWLGRLRYDRYFLEDNTVFAAYQMNGDRLAGLLYRIEPQIGYARLFVHSDVQKFRGELGYDYSYERYLDGSIPIDASFHSGRLFLFYENKFTPLASFSEGVEALVAFNVIKHWRVNSLTSLSSTIAKSVALKLNLTIKYNHDPPLRPNGTPFGTLDTTLEAVLAITFL
jgi:putative salt-induced outer membrane protein YdiY